MLNAQRWHVGNRHVYNAKKAERELQAETNILGYNRKGYVGVCMYVTPTGVYRT